MVIGFVSVNGVYAGAAVLNYHTLSYLTVLIYCNRYALAYTFSLY